MSAVRIIRALLLVDAAVLAVVPGERVFAGIIPQGTPSPCLAITEVSRVDASPVKAGATSRCLSRVQVTVVAKSYPDQKSLLAAVRHACRDKVGSVAGVDGVTAHLDSTGPDFSDPDTGFYMQSQDFKVGFIEQT